MYTQEGSHSVEGNHLVCVSIKRGETTGYVYFIKRGETTGYVYSIKRGETTGYVYSIKRGETTGYVYSIKRVLVISLCVCVLGG